MFRLSKFHIKHLPNLIIRFIAKDKYYVCEECYKIHKRNGKEIRFDKNDIGKLLSHRLWYGSVSEECYKKCIEYMNKLLFKK
jgi:hypothetical protein